MFRFNSKHVNNLWATVLKKSIYKQHLSLNACIYACMHALYWINIKQSFFLKTYRIIVKIDSGISLVSAKRRSSGFSELLITKTYDCHQVGKSTLFEFYLFFCFSFLRLFYFITFFLFFLSSWHKTVDVNTVINIMQLIINNT